MHQTFYIDIDEEISSVIDRLDKSVTTENYFVVPGRAIFLQSIVNLKLLKREADKLNKKVILVTQDEIGISMAEKAGIEVHVSLEETDNKQDKKNSSDEKIVSDRYSDENESIKELELSSYGNKDKQKRLKNIGSTDYYQSSLDAKEENSLDEKENLVQHIKISSSDTPLKSVGNSIEKKPLESILQGKKIKPSVYGNSLSQPQANYKKTLSNSPGSPGSGFLREHPYSGKIAPHKERTLEKMFSNDRQKEENLQTEVNIPKKSEGKAKKIIIPFFVFCFLAFGVVAAYLLVPSVEIAIKPNVLKDKIDISVQASADIDSDGVSKVSLRKIEKTEEFSLTHEVTGRSESSGKKASGKLVIYNEFSSSAQTLAATTRLESSNGKIFRITKNIVVPGTTIVGGSAQPGAIEVDVVADQPGDDYNIEPDKFTIPGFSGSPKFNKFYAKSSEAFSGGSLDGNDGEAVVSQKDLDDAKTKAEAALNEKIKESTKSEIQSDEVVLPDMQNITIEKSVSDAKIGDITNSLSYNVSAKFIVFVFSQKDVEKIILNSHQDTENASESVSKIEYGGINVDFEKLTAEMKILAEVAIIPEIDTEKIKKEILGKDMDQLSDILSKYSYIKNADAHFSPSFMSHVPQFSQRVIVTVDEKME